LVQSPNVVCQRRDGGIFVHGHSFELETFIVARTLVTERKDQRLLSSGKATITNIDVNGDSGVVFEANFANTSGKMRSHTNSWGK
jgi:hypothetical protein